MERKDWNELTSEQARFLMVSAMSHKSNHTLRTAYSAVAARQDLLVELCSIDAVLAATLLESHFTGEANSLLDNAGRGACYL